MKVVRVSGALRSRFTANELSGWPDGIRYEDTQAVINEQARKKRAAQVKKQAERRRKKLLSGAIKPPKAAPVKGGINILKKGK